MEIYKNIDKLHLKLGCNIQEFEDGAGLPLSYSDRLSEEINLLLNACGIFDLKACWLIALKGKDAGTFLHGMVTSNVLKLNLGDTQSSLICDNKGRISHHLEIFRSHEKEWIVICDPGEGRSVGTFLDNFHIREDFELRLLNSKEMLRLDLIGPNSFEIFEKIGGTPSRHIWNFEGMPIYTSHFKLGKTLRLINLVHINIFENFVKKIIKYNMSGFVSQKSFDEIRIYERIPRIGMDYNVGNFPQEAGLGDHISYEKGCYIGQEPHARMYHRGHPNWISVVLKIPEKVKIFVGKSLFYNSNEVGKVTSLCNFAQNGFLQGIGMIRNEVAKEQIKLSLNENSLPVIKQNKLLFNIEKPK